MSKAGRPAKSNEQILSDVVQRMMAKWPAAIVSRQQVPVFTGGCISSQTMACLDSKGCGPKKIIRAGRTVAYDVEEFCRWLVHDFGLVLNDAKQIKVPESYQLAMRS